MRWSLRDCILVASFLATASSFVPPHHNPATLRRSPIAMAKLYFRYGSVSSAKTLNLLATAHTYKQQGKRVVVLKPALDTRFGANNVASRAGLDREADYLLEPNSVLPASLFDSCHCVLVDEAQFVSAFVIDQLRAVASLRQVPVIAYGLRTDFRSQLFEGSKRLFEVADSIEEVKTTCAFCNKKAVFNLKSADGVPTLEGPVRTLGCEELYLPVCAPHFYSKLELGPDGLDLHKRLAKLDLEKAIATAAAHAMADAAADGPLGAIAAAADAAAEKAGMAAVMPVVGKAIDLTEPPASP
jgi:thymidine kinase